MSGRTVKEFLNISQMSQQESTEKKQIFSTRLKSLRLRKGIGQEELAQAIEVSNGSIGNWEGKSPNFPQAPTLRKLAKYFGCEVEYLRGEDSAEPIMYGMNEESAAATTPTREICRKHFDFFLETCDDAGKIGWTYWELTEKFPLDKWKSKKE